MKTKPWVKASNDVWKRDGTFRASQAIGRWLRGLREEDEFYA